MDKKKKVEGLEKIYSEICSEIEGYKKHRDKKHIMDSLIETKNNDESLFSSHSLASCLEALIGIPVEIKGLGESEKHRLGVALGNLKGIVINKDATWDTKVQDNQFHTLIHETSHVLMGHTQFFSSMRLKALYATMTYLAETDPMDSEVMDEFRWLITESEAQLVTALVARYYQEPNNDVQDLAIMNVPSTFLRIAKDVVLETADKIISHIDKKEGKKQWYKYSTK